MLPLNRHGHRAATTAFWGPVAVIATAQFLVIMNNAIINIALPSLAHDLHMSAVQWPWAVTTYLVSFGSLLLIGGRVGDALGHRRAFIGGLLATALAALGAGCATSPMVYFACRIARGGAAAVLAPAAVALLSATFTDPVTRARAFGVYGGVTGAGTRRRWSDHPGRVLALDDVHHPCPRRCVPPWPRPYCSPRQRPDAVAPGMWAQSSCSWRRCRPSSSSWEKDGRWHPSSSPGSRWSDWWPPHC